MNTLDQPGQMDGVHLGDPNARRRTPAVRQARAGKVYVSRDETTKYRLMGDGSLRSLVDKPRGKRAVKAAKRARQRARRRAA